MPKCEPTNCLLPRPISGMVVMTTTLFLSMEHRSLPVITSHLRTFRYLFDSYMVLSALAFYMPEKPQRLPVLLYRADPFCAGL